MFDPDTDARRMLVRERHRTLALDGRRPEPGHAAEVRRTHLRWPALHLRGRLALLGARKPIAAAHGEPQRVSQEGGRR